MTFTLTNPPAKPAPYRGKPEPKHRQRVLLSGMDCLAGQQDLFETDGQHQPQGVDDEAQSTLST